MAFWTGYDLPNGRPKDLVACTSVHLPLSSEMKKLVMQNMVVQAHYYKLCCRVLIDTMFGCDSSVNKSKALRGIFGIVQALFYALEQQGRLRAHHYCVLWVPGLPKTRSDWDELLGCEPMRKRFEEYCASLFATDLPVFEALASIGCPSPDCDGSCSRANPRKMQAYSQARDAAAESCRVLGVLRRGYGAGDGGESAGSQDGRVRIGDPVPFL